MFLNATLPPFAQSAAPTLHLVKAGYFIAPILGATFGMSVMPNQSVDVSYCMNLVKAGLST